MRLLILLFCSLFLVSCVEMYGTANERSVSNSKASSYKLCKDLAIATLAPESIREEWAIELQRRNENCSQYSASINNAIQSQANLNRLSQSLLESSKPYTLGSSNSNSTHNIVGTAFLKNSYVSGMNRVCIYNNMGSTYTYTVKASRMCPASLK